MSLYPAPMLAVWSWSPVDLLNHIWQSTVVAVALLALMTLCLRFPARIRLALGWMALAKFALPFALIAHLFTQLGGVPERWLSSHRITVSAELPAFVARVINPETRVVPAQVQTVNPEAKKSLLEYVRPEYILPAFWLAGFAFLYLPWIVGGFRLRHTILSDATPLSRDMHTRLVQAATRAGLSRLPRSAAVRNGYGPGLLGTFSPVLILPRGLESRLSTAELDSILLHECIHLKRGDTVWGQLQVFAVSLLWFNPVTWLLGRWIRSEMEKACDEEVVGLTGDAESYAEGILKVVCHSLGLPEPRLLGVITPPVISRVRNILRQGNRRRRRWLRPVILTLGLTLLALGGHAGSLAIAAATHDSPAADPLGAVFPPAGPSDGWAALTTPDGYRYTFPGPIGAVALAGNSAPAAEWFAIPPEAAAAPSPAALPARFAIAYGNVRQRELLQNLAALFGFELTLPPTDTLQQRVNASLADVSWEEVFARVLDGTGYTLSKEGAQVSIQRPSTIRDDSTDRLFTEYFSLQHLTAADLMQQIDLGLFSPVEFGLVGYSPTDPHWLRIMAEPGHLGAIRAAIGNLDAARPESAFIPTAIIQDGVTRVISPEGPGGALPAGSDTVFEDADVRFVLGQVAAFFQLQLNLPESVQGRASVSLAGASWRQIFTAVLEPLGHTFTEQGDSVAVVRREPLVPVKIPPSAPVPMAADSSVASLSTNEGGWTIRTAAPVATPPTAPASVLAVDSRVTPTARPAVTEQPVADAAAPAGSPARATFAMTDLDRAPQPTYQTQPRYPFEMKRMGITAEVTVTFIVDETGAVRDVNANDSSNIRFNSAAVEAVKQWIFRPGQKDGQPVRTRMVVPILFTLDR